MKNGIRKLICLVVCVCICLSFAAGAYAKNAGDDVILEQCRIFAPQVSLVFYPVNAIMEINHGYTESNLNVTASLDNEKLSVSSVARTDSLSNLYMVLLNNSVKSVNEKHIQLVQKDLTDWIDGLKENDRFVLITYSDEVTVLLDGSENREAAKKVIASLERGKGKTDGTKALEEAIRVSNLPENYVKERRVIAMIDPGVVSEKKFDTDAIVDRLIVEGLPVYTLCAAYTATELIMSVELSHLTGGIGVRAVADKETGISALRGWLDNGYVLRLEGTSNLPQPENRVLSLDIADQDGVILSGQYNVRVSGSIPDLTCPELSAKFSEDGMQLSVSFTEDVTGAKNPKNYILTDAKTGDTLEAESAAYDSATFTAVLNFGTPVPDGRYTLKVEHITDCSAEANPVLYPEGKDCVELSFGDVQGMPVWLMIVLAVAVLAALAGVVAAIVIYRKKTAPEITLPVQLTILSRDGQKYYRQVAVGKSFTIGRAADKCSLALQGDPKISRCHLQLSYDGKTLMAVDAGSQNGSMVNGVRIDKQRMINSGDVITIGYTQISVVF